MTNEELEQLIDDDLRKTSRWLLYAFLLGWLATAIRYTVHALGGVWQTTATEWIGEMCTSLLWTLAWLAGGFVFGFLFGIPKVITQAANPPNSDLGSQTKPLVSLPRLKVNTNLEDISDWLTKVLVGATLTQLLNMPVAISRAAAFMANGNSGNVGIGAAIVLYYSALGFLSGYIITRMFFARAFALADRDPNGNLLTADDVSTLTSVPVAPGQLSAAQIADPVVQEAARASASVPLTDTLSGSRALAVAKGAAVSGDAQRALTAASLAMGKIPLDPTATLTYAWSLRSLGVDASKVIPIVEEAAKSAILTKSPKIMAAVFSSLAFLHLYEDPPGGFDRALGALSEYDRRGGQPNPDIELNRACAYAQQFKYLSEQQDSPHNNAHGSQEEIAAARLGALNSIKKSLAMDPSELTRFRELMWKTADPVDDDLSVFQNDPDFVALIPRQ
jgi:hypothetical protein